MKDKRISLVALSEATGVKLCTLAQWGKRGHMVTTHPGSGNAADVGLEGVVTTILADTLPLNIANVAEIAAAVCAHGLDGWAYMTKGIESCDGMATPPRWNIKESPPLSAEWCLSMDLNDLAIQVNRVFDFVPRRRMGT